MSSYLKVSIEYMDVSITLIRMSLNFEMMKLTLACSLHFVLCKILFFWKKFVGHIWYFKPFSLLDTKFIPCTFNLKQTNKHCNKHCLYCFWWLWKFLFGMIHMWAILLHGQCILRHVLIFCMIIHKETFFNIYMNLFANELLFQ